MMLCVSRNSTFQCRLDLDGEELFARGLQPVDDDLSHAFHQFVAEVMAALGGDERMRAAEDDGARRLDGPCLQVPGKWREQPGPAQHIAGTEGLDDGRAVGWFVRLQGNLAA